METEGYIEQGTAVEIKLPKATRKNVEILTEEEIKTIFTSLEEKPENHNRDQLILMILLECEVRLEEVISMKLRNVHVKINTLKVL